MRSDEAKKRRLVISEAKLKAKRQARKDGKSLPSGKTKQKYLLNLNCHASHQVYLCYIK